MLGRNRNEESKIRPRWWACLTGKREMLSTGVVRLQEEEGLDGHAVL